MRKRLLASLLSLVMILTMLPTAAFAVDDPPAETPPVEGCICTELCTEETVNSECPVCGGEGGYAACTCTAPESGEVGGNDVADGADPGALPPTANRAPEAGTDGVYEVGSADELTAAFGEIATQEQKEATIVLTADIQNDSGKMGVEGKLVTFQSADGQRHSLKVTSLNGDCIFDTVDFSNENDDLSAYGHYLELTENFTGELNKIYGANANASGKVSTVGSVDLVLKGGSSTLIQGTGSNVSTTGDVNITLDGHVTKELRGGASAGYQNAPHIGGDININVYSGAVTERFYGGMWSRDDFPRNCVVEGDINVQIGRKGNEDETALVDTSYDFAVAGRYGVINNVNFTIEDGAYITGERVYVAGLGCEIKQTVNITINGGYIKDTPLVIAGTGQWNGNDGETVEIGTDYYDESSGALTEKKDVVTLTINDGRTNTIYLCSSMINQPTSSWKDPDDTSWYGQIYGNVKAEQHDGKIVQYIMGYQYCKTWGDCTLTIDGGEVTYSASAIQGDDFNRNLEMNDGYVLGDTNVIFDGLGQPDNDITDSSFWGIGKIKAVNNVILEENTCVNGTASCLLDGVGSLTMGEGSALALRGGSSADNTVLGDCTFDDNTTLVMNRNAEGDTSIPALLSVGGKVTGQADLYTVNNGSEWTSGDGNTIALSMPVEGEVYMRSKECVEAVGSGDKATQLVLANTDAAEPYVEYTTDQTATGDSYRHAWRIKGEEQAQEQLWYYEVYYEFYDPDTGESEWLLWKDGQGGWALPGAPVSISPEEFNNTDLGWEAIDGSGNETLGIHYIYDADFPNDSEHDQRLSATCAEATQDNPLKIYYRAAVHKVTYKFTGDTLPENAEELLPSVVDAPYASYIEIAADPKADGYTFSGWTVESPGSVEENDLLSDGILTMPNDNVVLVGNWEKVKDPEPAGTITVTPADITIYKGGVDGADGVVDVDDNGSVSVVSSTSLPTPGFTVTLPESLDETSVTSLTFKEKGGSRTWKFEPYDGDPSTTVYKLVPQGEGQEATRVTFTDANGNTVVSDEFDVGAAVNTTFTMALYKGSGASTVGDIIVEVDGRTYNVDSTPTGTLTVRGTTEQVQLANINETTDPSSGEAAVRADAGTTYAINGGDVQVQNSDGVSLLFDGIINSAGNDRTSQLQARAETYFSTENIQPGSGNKFVYEFKYLDLVDAHNGNAWVAAQDASGNGKDVTIYWPLPAGTDQNTKFTLLHFEGLHRDMETGEIEDEISICNVEDIQLVGVTGTHVVFKIGSAGFSPFALVWEENTSTQQNYTVKFLPGDHGTLSGTTSYTVASGSVFGSDGRTVPTVSENSNYDFTGWLGSDGMTYTSDEIMSLTITGDMAFTAQYRRESSGGGGGGGGTTHYILHYESNGGTEYDDERYARNTVVDLDKVPTREGYTFTGWYADEELTERITEIKMTSNKTVYAGWEATGVPDLLNGRDHFAYVIGYADGTVRPLDNISRAEVATIIFRLLDPEVRDEYLTTTNTFEDVNEGMWCNTAISTLAQLGIVYGRTSTFFDPDASITRAEFAAICARFDDSGIEADSSFTDISGHWAEDEIKRAATLGWIRGYTDGTFRPNNLITRAEAMTMINRMLQRLPEDEDDLLDDMNIWPDNQPGDWYYLAVQEATNSHDFDRKNDGVHEHWTEMTADPDWKQYE